MSVVQLLCSFHFICILKKLLDSASPETDALMPPSGLRVTNVGRNAISVEWLEARMKNVRQSIIRYNVYLYIANTQRLISSRRFIKPTAW